MARGGRRTYTRDANGRFASAPGGGGGKARRPAPRKSATRAGNRLTRDNRGRITSIGGDGATARGGRLRTASGGMRARQTAALRSTALRSGTIAKGGRGVSGSVARSLAAVKRGRQGKPANRANTPPDLSQAAFERRARATEKRAKAAESVVSQIDRYNPANRKLVNRANSLRSAADSYSSYARRGKTDPDFSAEYLFRGRARSTTAPKLSRKEKAAATRRANADKRFRENIRRMEQDRRR